MPGIFGLAVGAPSTGLASTLDAMAEPMRRHPSYVVESRVVSECNVAFGRVSLGFVNSAPQPATNEDETLSCVMDGEIFDYASLRRDLESAGHRFSGASQAELLLHGFEQQGERFFSRLIGKFVAAIWDGKARRLILVNDRFGMKPLYYSQIPGRLTFASAIKSILTDPAVNRRPSSPGLAQFFTFGHLLGDDTLLEGVRLLPAAGWLSYDVDRDRLSLQRYWHLQSPSVVQSRAESLNRIDAAFGKAVERCTQDTEGLGLSLSGGMDARTILALAAQPGRSLHTVTLGMAGSIDQRSAAQMAKLAGCPNHHVVLGKEFLADYETHLRQMVQLTDGQYLCQCIVMPTLPVYRDLGIRVLLRGHAGELMHMRKAYNFSLDGSAFAIANETELMNWLWRRLQAYMLDGVHGRLFVGVQQSDAAALAHEALRACVKETIETEAPTHRIWQLFLAQRLRRETALSLVEFDSIVETRLPYLDNELIESLFAAPPDLKLGDEIQSLILRRRRPDFLKVVNANTGTAVGTSGLRQSVARIRTRVLAKLGVPGYQPYERLGLWLRRELRPLVEHLLLSERCLGRGVFEPQTVRSVVDAHLNARRNHTFLILALMIFETSQRMFENDLNTDAETLAAVGAA